MYDIATLLNKLTSFDGASGAENNAALFAENELSKFMPCKIDSLGNVIGSCGEGTHILLDAHIDQIGLSVREITGNGFIKVSKCGGPDARVLTAAQVTIHGDNQQIKGVVCSVPPHLQKDKNNEKVNDFDDIIIDIGMSKEKAEELILPGDRITFDGGFNKLLGNRVSAPSLDDRSGVAAILRCLEILKDVEHSCKISVMFSTQEETGGSGAKVGAFSLMADEAFSIDVSFAKQPGAEDNKYGELGKGPMIGFSPILDRNISKNLVAIATKHNIPYQCEIMGSRTGTNADEIQTAGKGVKCSVVSIPLRNMHTAGEICDTQDIENVAQLLAYYIIERGAENA